MAYAKTRAWALRGGSGGGGTAAHGVWIKRLSPGEQADGKARDHFEGSSDEGRPARFRVYSCRTEKDAERLYKRLPSYDRRTAGASLGDESVASGQVLDGTRPTTVFHDKVRVGSTVLWTFAMGSAKAVTNERAEQAATQQTDRVEQARKGLKPTATADVP
ncbi:hypothetical protein [Streptomyces sp. NPDC051684]|uniref:hypothetical protein n=1 Tax=Streptomyces sp. NPDC051684 TaxID=3365670 RepID=UPI00379F54C8